MITAEEYKPMVRCEDCEWQGLLDECQKVLTSSFFHGDPDVMDFDWACPNCSSLRLEEVE